jgi:hypothetical protein
MNAEGIYRWADGNFSMIIEGGTNPYLNSRGDVAYLEWNDVTQRWETWLYISDELRLIAASANNEIVYDMNELGDIVTLSFKSDVSGSEVVLYERLHDGDMNCDGKVTFDDIDGFTLALIDRAEYEAAYPDCDWWLADTSGDRKVDFDDIDPFVECIIKGCER